HAEFARELVPLAQLLGGPFRDADVERLALPHDVGERLERLFERRLVVEAVSLVQVNVIGAEAAERAVDRFEDVLAAQPGVVRPLLAGREVHLREDLETLASLPLQSAPE